VSENAEGSQNFAEFLFHARKFIAGVLAHVKGK
jgi:hypothetical protein